MIEGTIVDARDRDSRRWLVIVVDTNDSSAGVSGLVVVVIAGMLQIHWH